MSSEQVEELIKRRRLQLLVHSAIYHIFDDNIISDHQWDVWAKELATLQKQYPEISKKVVYYNAFKDFEGDTANGLPYWTPRTVGKARYLLSIQRRKNED